MQLPFKRPRTHPRRRRWVMRPALLIVLVMLGITIALLSQWMGAASDYVKPQHPPACTTLSQVVFVSCNRHDRSQLYWRDIAATALRHGADPRGHRKRRCEARMGHPPVDALVWLGDAIYADKRTDDDPSLIRFGRVEYPLSTVEMMWKTQHNASEYVEFREHCVRRNIRLRAKSTREVPQKGANVFGTWDDHDMGMNDGGKEYMHKNKTQGFFLDFLDTPIDDPRRLRRGVYSHHHIPIDFITLQERSQIPDAAILAETLTATYPLGLCLILLDVRSHRDPPSASPGGDVLGEEQWTWLEQRLREVEGCALTLIGGGIQFMMDEKTTENWSMFPHSRNRLLELVRRARAQRVAFLSGDVHLGEIGIDHSPHTIHHVLGYPLVEATSSGLTHSANMFPGFSWLLPKLFPSSRRVGIYVEKNFGTIRLELNEEAYAAASARMLVLLRQTPSEPIVTALRQLLGEVLRVSISIYALDHSRPEPAVRLHFDLRMLSHENGPAYASANVDTSGLITPQSRGGAAKLGPKPTPTNTTPLDYPNTNPLPPLTAVTRAARIALCRSCSLPAALVTLLGAAAAATAAAAAIIILGSAALRRDHVRPRPQPRPKA